jgi:hypothetical protein
MKTRKMSQLKVKSEAKAPGEGDRRTGDDDKNKKGTKDQVTLET